MTTQIGPDVQAPTDGVRVLAPADRHRWLPSYLMLAAIWGTSFLFIKVGVRELHPLWLTFGRVAAGVLTLLVVLAVTRDRLPRDARLWGHLTVVALPLAVLAFRTERMTARPSG